jgi:hypothetical protein
VIYFHEPIASPAGSRFGIEEILKHRKQSILNAKDL